MNWNFLPPFLLSGILATCGSLDMARAQETKPSPNTTAPDGKGTAEKSTWVTSIALGTGHDRCILSSGTGLLLRPGEILKGKIDDLSKAEKIGELPASAWKVVLVGDSKLIASDYTGGIHIGSLSEPGSWKKLDAKLRWSRAMAVTKDGRVIIGTEDGKLVSLKLDDQSLSAPVDGHKSAIFGLKISSDGSKLLSSAGEGNVKVWNVADLKMEKEISVGNQAVWDATFTANGTGIVTADANRRVNLYASDTGKLQMTLGIIPDWGTSIVNLVDDVVAVGCLNGKVYVFDANTRLRVGEMAGPGSGIWSLALCDDAKHLVVGTRSKGAAVITSSAWEGPLAETRKRAAEEQPPAP